MKNDSPELQFLGGAKTVTGSKTLLKFQGRKILIDCGLFQGPKELRELNWQPIAETADVDAVVLTHAHIDHSGYLPRLVANGFTGKIFCSTGTRDLCRLLLPDSAYLQEEDARYADKSRHSRHFPAKPLYTVQDAHRALESFSPLETGPWHEIFSNISVRFLRSGHILGSVVVQFSLRCANKVMLVTFSGDLGNDRQNVIRGPSEVLETDYLVMEGTYGDRVPSRTNPLAALEECISEVIAQRGILVIPAFAVGRAQEILYLIRQLEVEGRIAKIPVFLDSPMASQTTEIYLRHKDELKFRLHGDAFVDPITPGGFLIVQSGEESARLCQQAGPLVVVSAAGMLTGGRILHHLKTRLPKPENTVLFVGYQAEGTKGRLLQQGMAKIRIHHQDVEVKAKIVTLDSMSAHADSDELVAWVSRITKKPKKVFLNHGEISALRTLRYRLHHELDLGAVIPEMNQCFTLT